MNKNTICIFSAFYPPHLGGVENYTANLGKALIRLGNRVIVVTSALTQQDEVIIEDDGISVVRMPSILLLHERFAFVKKNKTTRNLIEWLKNQNINAILINTRFYPLSLFGLKFAKSIKAPAIVLDHGSAHLRIGNPLLDFAIERYEHCMTSIGKKYNQTYAAVSEKSAEWLKHFDINASTILHNAIDADYFCELASSRSFKDELKIDENSLHVVFIGRLMSEKGADTACTAALKLIKSGLDLHLTVAGDGLLTQDIESYAKQCSNIHYVGKLDGKDVSALLKSADALCLPSESEGFPTGLLEAAATNTAIITTDTGGARELIPDNSYGLILQDCSIEALENAILKYYNNRALMHLCAKNANVRVRELFTWDKTAAELENTFREI